MLSLTFLSLNIKNQTTGKGLATARQRRSDFSLHGYLTHNMTCFVWQLAHLRARREDKALGIRLKRFAFFSTFQLADLFPNRGADLLHNAPVLEVKRRGVGDHASGRRNVRIPHPSPRLFDGRCHIFTDVYLCLQKQTGANV